MGGPSGDRELGGQGRKEMTESPTNQATTQYEIYYKKLVHYHINMKMN